jgi:hypothetical protein
MSDQNSVGFSLAVSVRNWDAFAAAGVEMRRAWDHLSAEAVSDLWETQAAAGNALLDRGSGPMPSRSSPMLREASARIQRMLTEYRASFPPALKRAFRALRCVLDNPEGPCSCRKDNNVLKNQQEQNGIRLMPITAEEGG